MQLSNLKGSRGFKSMKNHGSPLKSAVTIVLFFSTDPPGPTPEIVIELIWVGPRQWYFFLKKK